MAALKDLEGRDVTLRPQVVMFSCPNLCIGYNCSHSNITVTFQFVIVSQ